MILLEPKTLGSFVRGKRERLGYTQQSVADAAGVGRQWVVDLELGKSGRPPLDLVIRILGVLRAVLEVTDLDARPAPAFNSASLQEEARIRERNGDLQRAEPPTSQAAISAPPTGRSGLKVEIAGSSGEEYARAHFESAGIPVDRKSLYKPAYRPVLMSMVSLVVDSEAPIFEDLLERRIASAHGQRRTRRLKLVISSLTKSFPSTAEGDRKVVWSGDANPIVLPPFRSDPLSLRDHGDIPLFELTSLAARFLPGRTTDEVIEHMSQHLGLSSVRPATRERLLRAVEDASKRAGATES